MGGEGGKREVLSTDRLTARPRPGGDRRLLERDGRLAQKRRPLATGERWAGAGDRVGIRADPHPCRRATRRAGT